MVSAPGKNSKPREIAGLWKNTEFFGFLFIDIVSYTKQEIYKGTIY
jgi:hypothetical protein